MIKKVLKLLKINTLKNQTRLLTELRIWLVVAPSHNIDHIMIICLRYRLCKYKYILSVCDLIWLLKEAPILEEFIHQMMAFLKH